MTVDKDIQTILDNDIRAKFKIEVHFDPHRSIHRESKTLIILMESGKFFHGGGDGQMFVCMDHRAFEKDNTRPPSVLPLLRLMGKGRTPFGCGSPIASKDIQGGVARCPGCHMLINALHLTANLPFFGTLNELAELVEILFHRLGDDADIYCKWHPLDIRYHNPSEFKNVGLAREKRVPKIYLLKAIMKDLGAGASLPKRLVACFRA